MRFVWSLLSHPDINPEPMDILGDTPLHRAAMYGCPEIIDLLLEKGVDINCQNYELKTPLTRAESIRSLSRNLSWLDINITHLVARGAGDDIRDVYGHDYRYYRDHPVVLDVADVQVVPDAVQRRNLVVSGDLESLQVFFQAPGVAVMDPINYLGDTLLSTAALFGRTDVLRFLLSRTGADINYVNNEKKGPLYWAVYSNHIDTVECLLKVPRIDVNFYELILGETVLHRAVINRSVPLVYRLLQKGADPAIPNRYGQTALHLCVSSPIVEREVLEMLLMFHSEVDHQDSEGRTALMIAADNNHYREVRLLLAYGADYNLPDVFGWSALERLPEIEAFLRERELQNGLLDNLAKHIAILGQSNRLSDRDVSRVFVHHAVKSLGAGIGHLSLDAIMEPYLRMLDDRDIRQVLEEVIKAVASSDRFKKKLIVEQLTSALAVLPMRLQLYLEEAIRTFETAVPLSLTQKLVQYETSQVEFSSVKRPDGLDPYTILAIDGGGIRGIIPAVLLCEIEKRTHKPISSLFNVVAGTSTGGILAAGLTTPGGASNVPRFSAFDLLDLYTRRADEIFPPTPFYLKPLFHQWPLFSIRYSEKPLEAIAHNYFGNRKLSQSLTNLIVTAYDTDNRTPYFFNRDLCRSGRQPDFFMRDVVRATSAAPTFFPPKIIGERHFIDGGVATNNPAMEAVSWAESQGVRKDAMFVVSLGTGEPSQEVPISQRTLFGGELFWASTMPGVAMNGSSFNVDRNLKESFRSCPVQHCYNRFQPLMKSAVRLDEAEMDNIQLLLDLGAELSESDTFMRVVERLLG